VHVDYGVCADIRPYMGHGGYQLPQSAQGFRVCDVVFRGSCDSLRIAVFGPRPPGAPRAA